MLGEGCRGSRWGVFVLLASLLLVVQPAQAEPGDGLGPLAGDALDENESPGKEVSEYEELTTGTEPWHRRPVAIMFRSTVAPGWGQLANGRYVKAAVVLGTEGYLIYRGLRAREEESDALAEARRDPAAEAFWLAEAESWNEEKRDYAWWTLFAVILSMGDAYVDAHLRGFDFEFEPQDGSAQLRWNWTFETR